MDSKVHFTTFYTNGGPEGGLDLRSAENCLHQAVANHVDSYVAYTKELLRELGGEQYVRSYDSKYAMSHNPGGHQIAFYSFKPFLLLKHLENSFIAPGEILIYRDVNCLKYRDYLNGIPGFRSTANKILRAINYDFYMPIEAPHLRIKHHCKAKVVRECGGGRPEIYEYPLLTAHTIIIRKSPVAIALLQHWLAAMTLDWLAPIPDDAQQHPEFRWHTADQAIFSVLCAKNLLAQHEGKSSSRLPFTLPLKYPYLRGSRCLTWETCKDYGDLVRFVFLTPVLQQRLAEILNIYEEKKKTCDANPHRPYDIVYSLLAEEAPASFVDTLINILWFNRHLRTLIIISVSAELYQSLQPVIGLIGAGHKDLMIFRETNRPMSKPVEGQVDLFHEHMKNVDYLGSHSFRYEYFVFLSDQQIFDKPVDLAGEEERAPQVLSRRPAIPVEEFPRRWGQWLQETLDATVPWPQWQQLLQDPHMLYWFQSQHIIPTHGPLEGLILPADLLWEMFMAYWKGPFLMNSRLGYCALEEIFPRSYLENLYEFAANLGLPTMAGLRTVTRSYHDFLRTCLQQQVHKEMQDYVGRT